MRKLRTVASALLIVLGAALIAAWALAQAVVAVVEDGTAVRAVTERALDTQGLMDTVAADLSERAESALMESGVDVAALGLDGPLSRAVSSAVDSQAFRATLLTQVDQAHEQVSTQLTDPNRPPADLIVAVDVSDSVNDQLGELGGLAAALPDLDVPAVNVTVLTADRFEQAREAYGSVLWAQAWCLWLAAVALGLGFAVSCRKRWFAAKALCAVAVIAWGAAAVVTVMGPDGVASFLPGGGSGAWAGLWRDVVGAQAIETVAQRGVIVGAVAVVGALIALAIGAAVGKRRPTRT